MLRLGKDVKIDKTARINVDDGYIGDRGVIGPNVTIEGRRVMIGRESRLNEGAHIGGGSCFDPTSNLEVGDFLHMGKYSFLNQGRGIKVGHEFGCGMDTKVFTHGSYESAWDGFPVQWGPVKIGDRVWLPNALVNPGISIGDNVVVASLSVVTEDLPTGCFAGGVPCRVIRERVYPRQLSASEKDAIFSRIFNESAQILLSKESKSSSPSVFTRLDEDVYVVEGTTFDIGKRVIEGPATSRTEVLRNQLRRNGIRFRYFNKDGCYSKW